MNRLLSLLLLILSLASKIKAQQHFRAGLKLGISTSQVAGDMYAGFNKAGLTGGAFVTAKFNKNWSSQFEIIYVQKGSRHNYNPEKGDFTFYFLQLDYIEIPLLIQFHQKKFTFQLGPAFGYLLKEEEYNEIMNLTGDRPFNKNEITVNIGIGYILYKKLGLNWRYSNSVTSIRSHASGVSKWYNPGQRNNVLVFSLIYTFGHAEEQ